MKKVFYLLPLLLAILACGAQPQLPQNVADIVNATLTAIAQDNLLVITPPTALTPIPVQVQPATTQSEFISSNSPAPTGNIIYFWPPTLPEGFVLSRENSHADTGGFALIFINPSGSAMSLTGGSEADKFNYCLNLDNNPSEPVVVRGLEGCFPPSTGGGFSVEWKEQGIHYTLGGLGISKEIALTTAEQLESIDLPTFLARLDS